MSKLISCTNSGCQKKFSEETNTPTSCVYHSGNPVFHEGLKGWSCCKPRETHFDDFLNLKGCTEGLHQHVEKPKAEARPHQPIDVRFKELSGDGKEVYSTTNASIGGPPSSSSSSNVKVEIKPEVEKPDAIDAVIPKGAECLHNGCSKKFLGDESRSEPCEYHPGMAIFHEGSKYWKCCRHGVLDFEDMIKQPGCTSGKHKFVKDGPVEGALVACRVQSYQSPLEVCLDVFAKGVDAEKSTVEISAKCISLKLVMSNGTRYEKSWSEIPWSVNVAKSRFTYRATKVEVVLNKAEAGEWNLDYFK